MIFAVLLIIAAAVIVGFFPGMGPRAKQAFLIALGIGLIVLLLIESGTLLWPRE